MHPYHHPLFIHFIVYFNRNQDYFECHEVLEEYWKSIKNADKTHPLTAFILMSTGMYHFRRGNLKGAKRTLEGAKKRFHAIPDDSSLYMEEINVQAILDRIADRILALENEEPFTPFQIEVLSPDLTLLVAEAEERMDLLQAGSNAVIHKHMLRDRTDILLERQKKKRGRL